MAPKHVHVIIKHVLTGSKTFQPLAYTFDNRESTSENTLKVDSTSR